jgi:DDE superfamily endonuclease
MAYSDDFRWRIVSLILVYDIGVDYLSDIFGPSVRTIKRWYALFLRLGDVHEVRERKRSSRWPPEVVEAVGVYCKEHPTFYLDELQGFMKQRFPQVVNVSLSSICRALRFDLKLSRKVITKRAMESMPAEIQNYKEKLSQFYSYPEQLVFVDETSKDGRDSYRKYGRSAVNQRCTVRRSYGRGSRVSVLAALDCTGFIAWRSTDGTFTRGVFHDAMVESIIPLLNPWPLPRSILIIDNARIHMYAELEKVIHERGAILLFLPPYSPHLNPIEFAFGRLKSWIQRHANLVYPLYPVEVLRVAMVECTKSIDSCVNTYAHCGYGQHCLNEQTFSN